METIIAPLFGKHLRIVGYVVTDAPTELQLQYITHLKRVRQSVQQSKRLRRES